MKKTWMIGFFLFLDVAFAQNSCYRSGAKECPTSGSTLLDDTYPVSSYVVSVAPFVLDTPNPEKVPAEFILKVLKSHQYGENAPNIIIPASQLDYEKLRLTLEKAVRASNGAIPDSILNKVIPAGGESYTWQQDYFESFFNPATGRPVLRRFESYTKNEHETTQRVTQAGNQANCEIAEGPGITSDHSAFLPTGKSFGSGEMGGNVEGLPGGLCLTGDNQSPLVSESYCGNNSNVVQIDVSWLEVGHVDEVAKIIPTERPGVPRECQFSLMVASPSKALELMSSPRSANHPVISGNFLSDGASAAELQDFRDSRASGRAGRALCQLLAKAKENRGVTPPEKSAPGKKAKEAYYRLLNLLVPSAIATTALGVSNQCDIETLTNKEFLDAYKGSPLEAYNTKVSETMKANQDKIVAKIKERLPQCARYIQVVEVPDLFYGSLAQNSDGTTALSRNGNSGSIFPNPTNSVVMNKGVIFPDPQSPLFRDYLSQELKKGGLNAEFIDTWDYSHLGDGNLHCSSHSIPYCSPATQSGGTRR